MLFMNYDLEGCTQKDMHFFEKNRKLTEVLFLAVYFASYILLSVLLALTQPHNDTLSIQPFSPPDEVPRMLVPDYICENGKLPTGFEPEVIILPYGFSYALYNTFPYIVQGYTMRLALMADSDCNTVIVARMVDVFMGLFMSLVIYLLARRMFEKRGIRYLFCCLVTFLPQALFVHTYVNNDSMAMLSTAMIMYGFLWAYKDGFNIRNSLWISFGVVLCALSYYNCYGYILCGIILFICYFIRKGKKKVYLDFKAMWPYMLLIGSICLLGAGWWFVRSAIVLDGDFLGLKTRVWMTDTYGADILSSANTYKGRGIGVIEMLAENSFFTCLYQSFVGVFGSLSIVASPITYQFYKLLFAAGALAIIYAVAAGIDCKLITAKTAILYSNLVLCIIIPLILLIRYAYTIDYQAQGRYMLPALVPLMYIICRAFDALTFTFKYMKYIPKWAIQLVEAVTILAILLICYDMVFVQSIPAFRSL